jgi:2-keto-3-deoxy-6-phosphogluconate aldolase
MSACVVTANLVTDGLALLVGLGGRLGVICSGAVIDAGLRGIAVAQAADAIERIHSRAPRVVIVPGTLTHAERDPIVKACDEAFAELVILPTVVELRDVAHAIAKALAVSSRRQRISSVAIAERRG